MAFYDLPKHERADLVVKISNHILEEFQLLNLRRPYPILPMTTLTFVNQLICQWEEFIRFIQTCSH